ncbi:hypothetical protein D3C74_269300 [compost metagenome]
MVAYFSCRKRSFQQAAGNLGKIFERIKLLQQSALLELRNPDDIQPGYVRQFAGTAADLQFLMQVLPREGNRLDLNPGIFLLKFRDEHLFQRLLFRRCGTIMMPER